jgi:hypothetical protein
VSIFGKSCRDYVGFLSTGLVLIVVMGLLRFGIGISGLPYDRATHLTSVTILVFLLAVIYGQRAAALRFGGYRHLIPIALLLSFTMYGFIVLAITVEGVSGIRGYFHAPGSGYAPHEMGLLEHVVGQLSVMGTMTMAILGTAMLGYLLSRHLAYLRNAFLLLAAMAVLRFVAGTIGIPFAVGSWITSLSLLSLLLAAYYGYRGSSQGFDGYPHMLLIGFIIAFAATHLVAYGIAVTDGLGISSYYHAPGTLQPRGTGVRQHIEAQLRFSPVLTLVLTAAAATAFALGGRTARSPNRQSV